MHIANGVVSDPVCVLSTVASSAMLGIGVMTAQRGDNRWSGQSLAAVGGLVFAAQMVNFPVDHGASGHLIGGALAAALLGPWGAMWAMASVLTTQALVFGDGGVGSLGANLLAMAVVAPWTAWLVCRSLAHYGVTDSDSLAGSQATGREALCWGVAAAVSVLAAATVCSLVLALGGAAPAEQILPAMLWAHLSVGIVEGVATAAMVLLAPGRVGLPIGRRAPVAIGAGRNAAWTTLLIVAATVAVLLAPFASSDPDGLERVAESLGFSPSAAGGFAGLLPDYALPGIAWAPLAVALAGLVGVAVVSAAGYLVGRTFVGRTMAGAWKSR